MQRRAIDLLLLALLAPGVFLAWRTGLARDRLATRYEALRQVAGDLPVSDPTKAYFAALETGDPLHFAWRAYLPPNYALELRHLGGGMTSNSSTKAEDFIARVRLRGGPNGTVEVYGRFGHSSFKSGIGDSSLAEFVRAHARELRVEQLGSGEVAALDPKRGVTLLRLTVPDDLLPEAKAKLSPHVRPTLPVLFQFELGPTTPDPRASQAGGGG
jgi:hypothetical protein